MILQSVLGIEAIKTNIEIQQVMFGIYESVYGIFNHVKNLNAPLGNRRPLAGVAFHRGEDFTSDSVLEDTMTIFRDLPIKEIFGINYLEFMKLPVDIVEMIVKVAKERYEKDIKAGNKAGIELQKAIRERDLQQPPSVRSSKNSRSNKR
ncbi:MAG TPA: hypothetical protein VN843_01510 [Anaerolineales bacterium]|nr:hypothetical protein [Anaerolineales bacterium]